MIFQLKFTLKCTLFDLTANTFQPSKWNNMTIKNDPTWIYDSFQSENELRPELRLQIEQWMYQTPHSKWTFEIVCVWKLFKENCFRCDWLPLSIQCAMWGLIIYKLTKAKPVLTQNCNDIVCVESSFDDYPNFVKQFHKAATTDNGAGWITP